MQAGDEASSHRFGSARWGSRTRRRHPPPCGRGRPARRRAERRDGGGSCHATGPGAGPFAEHPRDAAADRLRPPGARAAGRVDRAARVPSAGLRARLDDALARVPPPRRGRHWRRLPCCCADPRRGPVVRGNTATIRGARTSGRTRSTSRTARPNRSARRPAERRTSRWGPAARLRRRPALLFESRALRGHVVLRAGEGIAGGDTGVRAPLRAAAPWRRSGTSRCADSIASPWPCSTTAGRTPTP